MKKSKILDNTLIGLPAKEEDRLKLVCYVLIRLLPVKLRKSMSGHKKALILTYIREYLDADK